MSHHRAGQLYGRLVNLKQVLPVDRCLLKYTKDARFGRSAVHRGGGTKTPVATVAEMSEILRHCTTCDANGSIQRKRKFTNGQQDDDLYIMRYAFLSDCVKIGRSHDPERRRRELESGHIFRVEIVEICPGKGYLEQVVHKCLEDRRNTEGAGTEWFNVSITTAIKTVKDEIASRRTGTRTHTSTELTQTTRTLRQYAIALRQSARALRQRDDTGPRRRGRPPKSCGGGTEPRDTPPGE